MWDRLLDGVHEPTRLLGALPPAPAGATATGGSPANCPPPWPRRCGPSPPRTASPPATSSARVWGVLLGRLTGRADVMFGSTVSGRGLAVPGIERSSGCSSTPSRRGGWAPGVRSPTSSAAFATRPARNMDHEHVALTELQQRLGVAELFDTLVVVENYPDVSVAGGDLRVTGIDVSRRRTTP